MWNAASARGANVAKLCAATFSAAAGAEAIDVCVAHGVVWPQAIFAQQLACGIVTINCGADSVQHGLQAIQGIVGQIHGRGGTRAY